MATVGCGGTLTDGAFPRTCALRLSDQTSYPQTHPELGTEEEDTGFPLATCPRSSVSQCSPIHIRGKKLLCPSHPLGLGSTKQPLGLAHPAGRRKQGLGSSFELSPKCWAPGGPGCPTTGHPAATCHQGCIHCGHWLLGLRSSATACPLPPGFVDGFRAEEVVLSCG